MVETGEFELPVASVVLKRIDREVGNEWMRGSSSAGNFLPASSVSRNDAFSSSLNGTLLQQMHPISGMTNGLATVTQPVATPMVSSHGVLNLSSTNLMPPRSPQVRHLRRQQSALPQPSPAPELRYN